MAPARARAGIPSGSLYVANAFTVTAYAPGKSAPVKTIKNVAPVSIAFDASGNFYVGNLHKFGNDVVEYAPGLTSVTRTITTGIHDPKALAFDSSGDLYVANYASKPARVTIYSTTGTTPMRKITKGVALPAVLVFDSKGDLYVGNQSRDVSVYAPGSGTVLRTIKRGIAGPLDLKVNTSDALFAVNNFNVTVYPFGGRLPSATISDGTVLPSTMTFDASGNLYVANYGPNSNQSSVTVYNGSTYKLIRTITDGVSDPDSLAIDAQGNLYVANYQANSVTVYPRGKVHPSRTIRTGVVHPLKVAIGP